MSSVEEKKLCSQIQIILALAMGGHTFLGVIFVLWLGVPLAGEPCRSGIVWQIGSDDGSFSEFNHFETRNTWPWTFRVESRDPKQFPQELNDGVRHTVIIEYGPRGIEIGCRHELLIQSVSGAGPDFTIGVSSNGYPVGNLRFRTDRIDAYRVMLNRGTHIQEINRLELTNRSPRWSGRWLFFDYLEMKRLPD